MLNAFFLYYYAKGFTYFPSKFKCNYVRWAKADTNTIMKGTVEPCFIYINHARLLFYKSRFFSEKIIDLYYY